MPELAWTLQIAFAPAPPNVVEAVQEIEIETAIDRASILRIRIGLPQDRIGDWGVLALDPFRPLVPITVRVQAGLGVPEAVATGYAAEQQVTYAEEPGGTALEVTAMDATMLMNLQEKVTPWPGMPDSAIAAAIFGQHALASKVEPTGPVLVEPEGTTIQRGTDIRFLRRLARRNGFECFVQPEPLTGVDVGHFEPRSLTGLPGAVASVNLGEDANVWDFSVRYDMVRPTGVVGATLDTLTKAPQPALAPVAAQVPMGLEPALTRILPPPIVRPTGTGLSRTADLQAAGQAIADRSSFALVAAGAAGPDIGILRPGGLLNVRGAGRLFNGSYYVTRVQHRLEPGGYVQRFEAERNAVTMTGAELYALP